MMKKKIVFIGAGGHGKVVIDAAKKTEAFDICGIVDPKLAKNTPVLGIPVLGSDDILPRLYKKGITHAFIGVGSIGNCNLRKKIYGQLKRTGFKLPVIIHPRAVIAEDVKIMEGAFIAAGAVINTGTTIGANAIINTGACVDHDCAIGNFVHIAPGVTLSGAVTVGDETHIGTGTSIVNGIIIGSRCMIRAGTLVKAHVSNGKKV